MSQLSHDRNNEVELLYYKELINMLSLVPFKYFEFTERIDPK